jgi:hypothetical protein
MGISLQVQVRIYFSVGLYKLNILLTWARGWGGRGGGRVSPRAAGTRQTPCAGTQSPPAQPSTQDSHPDGGGSFYWGIESTSFTDPDPDPAISSVTLSRWLELIVLLPNQAHQFLIQKLLFRNHTLSTKRTVPISFPYPFRQQCYGSGSSDSYLWQTNPARILLFLTVTKTPTKINFSFSKLLCLFLFEGTFTSFIKDKSHKEFTKQYKSRSVFIFFLLMKGSRIRP